MCERHNYELSPSLHVILVRNSLNYQLQSDVFRVVEIQDNLKYRF